MTPQVEAGAVRASLGRWAGHNLRLSATDGAGLSSELIAFLRAHDGAYRQRRLRHLVRCLDEARQDFPDIEARHHDAARDGAWRALSLTLGQTHALPPDPAQVLHDPGATLRQMAAQAPFATLDTQVDALIAALLSTLPAPLTRLILLAYLGFAFYDVASLALAGGHGGAEMNPVQVDRISPQDIRGWGTARRLKGEEFHHFAAFFSRAYREHDYLLGRLHGAERMADMLASTSPRPIGEAELTRIKQRLFAAILTEEEGRLLADPGLIPTIRADIQSAMGGAII